MSKISSSLLQKLKETNSNIVKVEASCGKLDVKILTLKQQKDLLSTAVAGIKGAIEFTKVLNNILLENTDNADILTVDRALISLHLKKQSLGNEVKIDDDVYDIDNFISKLKTVEKTYSLEEVAKQDNITLNLKIPTLKQENAVINRCLLELDKSISKEDSSMAFGVIYLYELIKYIESITIDEETVSFSDLKIAERVEIVENLPLSVYKQLSSFFKSISEYENEILTFDEKTITIDPAFFDAAT